MSLKKLFLLALPGCAVLAVVRRADSRPEGAKTAFNSRSFDAIDAYLQEQLQRLNIPGAALAIVEGDQIAHVRGFGKAGPGGAAPTPQTPFFIGSLTKSFTALAVMQLVEAGKVELEAPVKRYLPWFRAADPQASAQITVRHLLNQTSGFSQTAGIIPLADFGESPDAKERQGRALASCKLAHPPGSAFEYSNVNYNLLGLIVEAASGEAYEAYIQKQLFDPLEMSHSFTSKAAARLNGLAVGHQMWFGEPCAVPDLAVPTGSLPSGQLISCAEDMAHYLIAHMNQGGFGGEQVLSTEGIAELQRPAVEMTAFGSPMGHYGMGWMIEESEQGRRIAHKGTCPDFFGYMAFLPGQKRGLILLANANHLVIDFAMAQVGAGAVTLLAGGEPKPLQLDFVRWGLRGSLVIPILQMAGAAATLRMLERWQRDPNQQPGRRRLWGRHILLPMLPNLILAAIPLALRASGLQRSMLLFMPDVSSIAMVCGRLAVIWGFVRTGLILRGVRKTR